MLRFARNKLPTQNRPLEAAYETAVTGLTFFCAASTARKEREFLEKNPDKRLVTTYSLVNGCPVPLTRVVDRPNDPSPSLGR